MEILHGVVPADEEDPGDLVDARVAVDAHGRDQPRVSLPLRHRHGGRRRRGQRGGGGRPGGRKVQIVLQMEEGLRYIRYCDTITRCILLMNLKHWYPIL